MNNHKIAGLSTKERKIISHFSAIEQNIINADDLTNLYHFKKKTANQILSRLSKKGWLQRLKRGIYVIVPLSSSTSDPAIENLWPVLLDIFKPAYISGWSAAEHWGLTEQIFNSISIVTLLPQRKNIQKIGGIKVRTRTIKNNFDFGLKKVWFGNNMIKIADPNRMIIDILDLPRFGGGGMHTVDIIKQYWNSDLCNPDLLLEYALKYNRGVIFKRLGFLAEKFNVPVSKNWIQLCHDHISKGISKLDPDGVKDGNIISRWNLKINLPL